MENSGSRASVESSPDDFVIVGGDPRLHIKGGVSSSVLKEDLKEILSLEDPSYTDSATQHSSSENEGDLNENKDKCSRHAGNSNTGNNLDSDPNDDSSYSNIGSDGSNTNGNDKNNMSDDKDNLDMHNCVNNYTVIESVKDNNANKGNSFNNNNKHDEGTINLSNETHHGDVMNAAETKTTTSQSKTLHHSEDTTTTTSVITSSTLITTTTPTTTTQPTTTLLTPTLPTTTPTITTPTSTPPTTTPPTTITPTTTSPTTTPPTTTPPTTTPPTTTPPTTTPPTTTPPTTTPPTTELIPLPTPPATTEAYTMDEDAMMFTGVLYLGGAVVNAPRSEVEVNRNISILNSQSSSPLLISLSVPSHSDGIIYLIDPPTTTIISSHPIHQILFCARGPLDTKDSKCFAFTCSHGNTEMSLFQCHVFKTDDPDVNVGKILYHFATAFRRTLKPSPSLSSSSSPLSCQTNEIHVSMTIDIKEMDGKNNYVSCPKEKDVFKMRCNAMKQVIFTLSQVAGTTKLIIDTCFGVLLSAGRNVKLNSMSLMEVVGVTQSPDNNTVCVTALFDPTLPQFELINTLTPKDSRVFMTVAVDVVVESVREPVKFLSELKAVLLPSNHKFWYFTNRQYVDKFVLFVKESEDLPSSPNSIGCPLEVVSIENQSEKDRKKSRPMVSSVMSLFQNSVEPPSPQEADFSDNDEPLLSGSGVVSKEVTDDALLQSWKDVLLKWHQNVKVKPKGVGNLVKKGIPEALRGEVWQLLVGCTDDRDMFETYRLLISKDSPCDDVITRDLNRTFPAHEFFQDGGGTGQESLYRICKAYSIYDAEVSYCQGVSFLTAALLLHMPEEQAFCVLVRTMYSYRLRELFRMDFEDLHLKFFQLERCIEDQMSNLHDHFTDLSLEGHMYASQWFLTLFTAKFPLFLVFSILDLFFSEGMPTIFGVALALLKLSRRELLALDFEGVLKYFRVQLPKKYRSEKAAREMMACALSMMPSERKLRRYETMYKAYKEEQMTLEDPGEIMKKESKRLQETNLRLERENDSLAKELVNSKIHLRNQLDEVEDKYECVNKELLLSRSIVLEAEDGMKMQTEEIGNLKELCRRECQNVQNTDHRNQTLIQDYKKICTQLSNRIENMTASHSSETQTHKDVIEACEDCKLKLRDLQKEQEGDTSLVEKTTNEMTNSNHVMDKDDMIRCLELELAQTKLALVECECRNQDLIHQLTSSVSSPNLSSLATGNGIHGSGSVATNNKNSGSSVRNSWLQKTLNSIKEATVVKASSFNMQ